MKNSLKHRFLIPLAMLAVPLAFVGSSPAMAEEPIPVTLANVTSFEISSFTGSFPLRDEPVDPEIAEYARTEMDQNKILPYRSPAQGILHFGCQGFKCGNIVARLTLGHDGPLLWQGTKRYHWGLPSYHRDNRAIAQEFVKDLEQAYQQSTPNYPKRIEVP